MSALAAASLWPKPPGTPILAASRTWLEDLIMKLTLLAAAALLLTMTGAGAQDTGFSDGPNGSTVHNASGFVCPLKLAGYVRDAVGPRDTERNADYCAYSALSGVYGTIIIMPLPSTFDPKAMLSDEFAIQEGTGGAVIDEGVHAVGPSGNAIPVYMRTYETARLESLHYRTLFASAAVGAWAVEVIVEYAWPRDSEVEQAFLNGVYDAAQREIGPAAEKAGD